MTTELILVWKNPKGNVWIPVGKLYYKSKKYFFEYTKGAIKASDDGYFIPFGQMKNLGDIYESKELFPIFQNRLLQKSRSEYDDYLEWLALDRKMVTPLEELARSGGIRATDNLQLFPVPASINNLYEVKFFSHGIRHLPPHYIERINHLSSGEKLYLMRDVQNEYDSYAIALRTGNPTEIVGYVPRFFSEDLTKLLRLVHPNEINVVIERINMEAPLQFKLLCKVNSIWPNNFKPFEQELFESIHQ
jgi:hypothetical protein